MPETYDILIAASAAELVDKVNAALGDGWVLHGGVSINSKDRGRASFFQAMIRVG